MTSTLEAASDAPAKSGRSRLVTSRLSGLPAHVFVRGFIRSYAKAVGISDTQPLTLFDRAVNAESEAERAKSTSPVVDPVLAGGPSAIPEDEDPGRRRGLGLAVFVLILVLIATITLSLLLRRPPQSGEGLSWLSPQPTTPAALASSDGPARDRADA
jgi:hypothetical protein